MKKNILFILLGIFFAMNTYNISAASPRAKHVILIGLDGWEPIVSQKQKCLT